MNNAKAPGKLLSAALTLPLLTACQTAQPVSSSAIERAAQTEREALCAALMPQRVSRLEYDASPPGVQEALTDGVAAWLSECESDA